MLISVLAAVISEGGRYLVCKRPLAKRHGGLWEFPGGKLEAGESYEDAAHRELAEELSVAVISIGVPLLAVHDEDSPYNIVFVPVTISGSPVPIEHDEIRWVARNDLLALDLAPSDLKFAIWLSEHHL